MNLIKQLQNNRILSIAKQKTYENVKFHNGFVQFLESLVINNLISPDYNRTKTDDGIMWDNQLLSGGIIFETNNNPFTLTTKDESETVTVTGDKQTLETFEYLLRLNNVLVENQSDAHDVEITIEYHDTLNPKLWEQSRDEQYHLFPEVLDGLNDIADQFLDFLDMPGLKLEDISITGSSSNYNWTEVSDLDLHLLVDLKKVEKTFGKLAHPYFDAQRKLWNDQHDIKVKGIPVECYVQDIDEKHFSSGIYSIKNKDWIKEPTKEKPNLDFSAIKEKSSQLMKQIDSLVKGCNKATPIEKMMDKLIQMRKAGLEDAGEFSTENYVYKLLRNNGYIDKLADCKTQSIDRQISVEEEEWDNIENEKDDPWSDIGYTRQPTSTRREGNTSPRTRINLNVPYSQRQTAAKMGAKWDAGIRKWYMMVTNEDLKKIPNAWR